MCPRATYPHNQVDKAEDIWATKLPALRRQRGTNEGCTEQDILNLEVWISVGAFICQQLYFSTVSLLFFILFESGSLAQVGFQFNCPGASRGEVKQCAGGAGDVQAPSLTACPALLVCLHESTNSSLLELV